MDIISRFCFEDTVVKYTTDDSGSVGLLLLPEKYENDIVKWRETLDQVPEIAATPFGKGLPARSIQSLVQLKCTGDTYSGGFAQGRTMQGGKSVKAMKYQSQQVSQTEKATIITTNLIREGFYVCRHILTHFNKAKSFEIQTVFENISGKPITLEMLSSFCLDGITPFDKADASGKLFMHRFRSSWSSEGRHECRSLEEMQLERSWAGACAGCERFGQVGSMPVRGFFPFIALEDRSKGVFWGAQLAWNGSWQMEVYRKDDNSSICGGIADREFGHWLKNINPGQLFTSPTATVAVATDELENLCSRLTEAQKRRINAPDSEKELPIVFNEWCTSWGNPTEEKMVKIADRIKDTDIKYLVIDAGWYAKDGSSNWSSSQGDWIVNKAAFPNGLKNTAEKIRQRGLIPGLWFEMEVAGVLSEAAKNLDHLFLKRDGKTIISGERMFWDFRKPETIDYLTQRVINLLRDCGFGYLKVDYNETIGIGADGSESQGESLRQHIEGVNSFFDKLKAALPQLVIENCSSGGHRLEPLMLGATSMSSFSDAHETKEIPIIAANLHNLLLPEQSQIWAVLRANDSIQRLHYSLAATLLGRMCISGDILELNDEQFSTLNQYQKMYLNARDLLRSGTSCRYGKLSQSIRYAKGSQAVLRTAADTNRILLVAHSFENGKGSIKINLPNDNLKIVQMLKDDCAAVKIKANSLELNFSADYSSAAAILQA